MLEIGGFGERATTMYGLSPALMRLYRWAMPLIRQRRDLADHLGDHALLQALSRHENPSRIMVMV